MSNFWRGWLNVWCAAVAVFGLVLAGAGLSATSGPSALLLDLMGSGRAFTFEPALHFAVALMGCVTLGWGLTLFAAFDAAHRLGGQASRTWRILTASVLVWYALDSLLSIATGFGWNAVSNTALVAGYFAPVLASGVLGRPATFEGAKA